MQEQLGSRVEVASPVAGNTKHIRTAQDESFCIESVVGRGRQLLLVVSFREALWPYCAQEVVTIWLHCLVTLQVSHHWLDGDASPHSSAQAAAEPSALNTVIAAAAGGKGGGMPQGSCIHPDRFCLLLMPALSSALLVAANWRYD